MINYALGPNTTYEAKKYYFIVAVRYYNYSEGYNADLAQLALEFLEDLTVDCLVCLNSFATSEWNDKESFINYNATSS